MKKIKINLNNILDAAIAFLITSITAVASSIFVNTDTKWFSSLIKPEFYPAPAVFTVAWAIVYAITAFVLARLLIKKTSKKTVILIIIQLILQILWTLVFFTFNLPFWSLIILIALVIINNIITVQLIGKDETAGWLYFIIFIWIVFACTLNYAIVMLN